MSPRDEPADLSGAATRAAGPGAQAPGSTFGGARSRLNPAAALGPDVAPSLARRVESIVTAADAAAADFRRDVERHAITQAEELRENAEAEAITIRREALADATAYTGESRRRVDQFASDRIARMSALTDDLIAQADKLQGDFEAATAVRDQLHALITAIGNVAAHVASIADEAGPRIAPAPWGPDVAQEQAGS